MSDIVVAAKEISKSYIDGKRTVDVLKKITFSMNKGDFVSIKGASGAGKSTLLNLLGSLDRPDSGELSINGFDLLSMPIGKMHRYRSESVGFIFQHHYLMPDFKVLENVMMPLRILGYSKNDAQEKAYQMLERIGVADRASHFPNEISGGESQRVAVARALVHKPPLVLADEPTGNLDSENTRNFIEILAQLQKEDGLSVLVVTHEEELAQAADKKMTMTDGSLLTIDNS